MLRQNPPSYATAPPCLYIYKRLTGKVIKLTGKTSFLREWRVFIYFSRNVIICNNCLRGLNERMLRNNSDDRTRLNTLQGARPIPMDAKRNGSIKRIYYYYYYFLVHNTTAHLVVCPTSSDFSASQKSGP